MDSGKIHSDINSGLNPDMLPQLRIAEKLIFSVAKNLI